MLKILPILLILLFTNITAFGQTFIYTFMDPCTKEITQFNLPIQSGNGTLISFLGQQKYFTADDVIRGDFANWINQRYTEYRKLTPCSIQSTILIRNQITSQIIGSTIQSVVGSIMGQVNAESGMLVNTDLSSNSDEKTSKNEKKSGSPPPTISTSGVPFPSTFNSSIFSSNNTPSSTNTTQSGGNTTTNTTQSGGNTTTNTTQTGGNTATNTTQTGGNSIKTTNQSQGNTTTNTTQTGGQGSGQGSGNNTTKTEGSEVGTTITMTTDANNDKGTGGKSKGKTNPIIISSDLTSAQNLDRSFTPIINIGTSQSSMRGTSSWGLTSMIWLNFKQFAVTGRYTKMHFSKNRKLKLIHNMNLTGVYSYGNIMSFLGYSLILNAGKFGITGVNVSGSMTKTPEDLNLYLSPAATAFYTKPVKVGKRMIVSPELYVISTPLIYSSVDNVSVSDRTFSIFVGTSVDYQFSKRFKVNMNYKLNTSTNPDFPVLSFFLIGSKINL
jgi:hypothetical protein